MESLFVYGTLGPGRPNAHILEKIGGTWCEGHVSGSLINEGWGGETGYAGIIFWITQVIACKDSFLPLLTCSVTGRCLTNLKVVNMSACPSKLLRIMAKPSIPAYTF